MFILNTILKNSVIFSSFLPVITISTSIFHQHRGFSSGKVLFLIMATIKVFWGRSPVVCNTCTCRNVRTLNSVFFCVCFFDFFSSVFKTHKLLSWELKEWIITFLSSSKEIIILHHGCTIGFTLLIRFEDWERTAQWFALSEMTKTDHHFADSLSLDLTKALPFDLVLFLWINF